MAEKTVYVFQQQRKAIKILKWKVREGTTVPKGRLLFLYVFPGLQKSEQRKLKSTHAGTIHKIVAQEGDSVKPGEVLLELEACSHPTIMNDMCAECGEDLRKDDVFTTASVPMIHAIPNLKVSEELAQKIGRLDNERLLSDRKLVLLVDLDQTLIHTTNDNIPPNMKDVYHFQLYGPHSPWYHTRLRPGTHQFLNRIQEYYELHICTFGARNYAHTIAMFLDANQHIFSNRILSRDECFDPTSKKANLKALFPCGDNMVCIIDDREDVWSHASNLIHVKPYHFFQHTGDINAPPGLDKQENDDKAGAEMKKFVEKDKRHKPRRKDRKEKGNSSDKTEEPHKEEINGTPVSDKVLQPKNKADIEIKENLNADKVLQLKNKAEMKEDMKAKKVRQQKNKADAEMKVDVKADKIPQSKNKADVEMKEDIKAKKVRQQKNKADAEMKVDVKADKIPQSKNKAGVEMKEDIKADKVLQFKNKAEMKEDMKTKKVCRPKNKADAEKKVDVKADKISQSKSKADVEVKEDIKPDKVPQPKNETEIKMTEDIKADKAPQPKNMADVNMTEDIKVDKVSHSKNKADIEVKENLRANKVPQLKNKVNIEMKEDIKGNKVPQPKNKTDIKIKEDIKADKVCQPKNKADSEMKVDVKADKIPQSKSRADVEMKDDIKADKVPKPKNETEIKMTVDIKADKAPQPKNKADVNMTEDIKVDKVPQSKNKAAIEIKENLRADKVSQLKNKVGIEMKEDITANKVPEPKNKTGVNVEEDIKADKVRQPKNKADAEIKLDVQAYKIPQSNMADVEMKEGIKADKVHQSKYATEIETTEDITVDKTPQPKNEADVEMKENMKADKVPQSTNEGEIEMNKDDIKNDKNESRQENAESVSAVNETNEIQNVDSTETSVQQNESTKDTEIVKDEMVNSKKEDISLNHNDESSIIDENRLIEVEDPDDYLIYLEDILKRIHYEFYREFDQMKSGEIPDLKQVIPFVKSGVLNGCHLAFSGLVPTHVPLEHSKAYQVARSLGAVVTQDIEEATTHLVAVRPGTVKVNTARRKKGGTIKIVTPDWLWCCAERWEQVDERIFPLKAKGSKNRHPPPHCSSPEHIPKYPEHNTPTTRKRTPSGRFMDTINPLMSFSSDDIADMDKEVEDILDDSESDSSEDEIRKTMTLNERFTQIMNQSSSSSSEDSLSGDYPKGFKRKRRNEESNNFEDMYDSTEDESPSVKFRRGESVDDVIDMEQDETQDSDGSMEPPDEVDDGEWNMMGAALEREFLASN